jgi:CubicO group peptidase (beta-lactamase class C family)
LDRKVLSGIVLGLVLIVAVVGVMIYYLQKPNTTGINTPTITTNNQNTTNNTNPPSSSNQLALTLYPGNQKPGSNTGPTPNPTPTPGPSPIPDSMDHIISLFDAYLNKYYDQSLIPGMAVVIVKDGKIIYLKTLGVRDLASGAPVDKYTLFGIGSNTKTFSATLVGKLVSEGKMSWDDPVSKYFPELKLNDPVATKYLTIRDALCHRSGLPEYGGDSFYVTFNDSYGTALYKLRYVGNTTPFRSTHQYNNMIYALGGYSAARASHTTWNALIKKDILIPLGMTNTVSSYWDFLKTSNHVTPYKLLRNGTMMPYDIIPDPIGPAGSLYSSINEMAHWLKFQLNGTGYYNGVKILNKFELDETHTGQIKRSDVDKYGLGWYVENDCIWHDGSSQSFHSQITLFPSKGVGIVILSNGGTYAKDWTRKALNVKFKDLIRGNYTSDPWPAAKKNLDDTYKPLPPTPPIVGPELPLKGYTGVYSNNLYGNINIKAKNNVLFCYYGDNKRAYEMKHWNNNTYSEPTSDSFIIFDDIHNGKAHQLVTFVPDYSTVPAGHASIFNRTK